MSARNYVDVVRVDGVPTLFGAAFVARIPMMAAPLLMTLYVVDQLDGTYAQAGLVAAVETVGAAVGSPWRGRLLDKVGLRRTVLPSALACGVLFPAAGFAPYPVLLPLAFFAGLLLVPIFSVVRLALAAMVAPRQHRSAFALDGVMAEMSFIVGPAAGALLATTTSPRLGLVVVGLATAAASLTLVVLDPPLRSERPAGPAPAPTRGWITPQVLLLFFVSASMTVALVGTDLSIVAEMRDLGETDLIGVVFLAWGAASLLAGLVYGALPTSIRPSWLALALGLLTMAVALGHDVTTLALWTIPAGALCAPSMTAATEWLVKLVPEDRRGVATGLQGTAYTVGGAIASPLVGATIDARGAEGGFVVGGAMTAVMALVAIAGQRVSARRPRERMDA